ncbi:hypothetical protein TNIN_382541 [Trichonephila inaurata madagascariensis]|uniref:Uncharacterized protein n=1 Tax=Trichonephila inaurata madagascariensis TaxID=2747483 RepID=A0A8X6Y402_9ARAC|nr:hypothetical protein TNIN_382541 [Trichonephila inaurata madagascariensis]
MFRSLRRDICFGYQPNLLIVGSYNGALSQLSSFLKKKPDFEGFWTNILLFPVISILSRMFCMRELKNWDVFPSKDQVIRYGLPPHSECIVAYRIIDDCTEIEVQKPGSVGG